MNRLIGYISWYRITMLGLVFVPFLLCQSYFSLIPIETWERWSEVLYEPFVLKEAPSATPSSVAVIEIGSEDERQYGWPIERSRYVELLDKLKNSGRPWILSYLRFKETGSEEQEIKANRDLADAINDYGKYIGSGLTTWSAGTEEIDIDSEGQLLIKALLFDKEIPGQNIPDFSLALDEDQMFIEGQINFGMGMRFGTQSTVFCTPLYFRDQNPSIKPVLATSVLLAAAQFGNANIEVKTGARSFIKSKQQMFSIESKNCLSSPSMSTTDFFNARNIEIIPFHKILEESVNLKDKIVILASSRMKAFQGPGADIKIPGSGIVPEHLLSARFLDDLLTRRTVNRRDLIHQDFLKHLPGLISLLFMVLSLFLNIAALFCLSFLAMSAMVGFSIYLVNIPQIYLIPLPLFAHQLLLLLGFALFWSYFAYYKVRRIVQFRENIRQFLATFQTYDDFIAGVTTFLGRHFVSAQTKLISYHDELYKAAQNPDSVAAYLATHQKLEAGSTQKIGTVTSENSQDISAIKVEKSQKLGLSGQACWLDISFEVSHENVSLGAFQSRLRYKSWEGSLISPLSSVLHSELKDQWVRIHKLIERKIADYQLLINSTRTKILEQFLTEVLLKKFSDGRTMEENLREVLVPKEAKAAILQADIRGFSGLFASEDSATIVNLLSSYYSRTVDFAQRVAHVKLIGDCIFLFIEEEEDAIKSAADYALQLAGILIRETEAENRIQAKEHNREPVVFGIAIHFGDVIMGNLSSSNCIDYTVIGSDVNRTARMEEITKKPAIRQLVGANGVVLSCEAIEALRFYKDRLEVHKLHLPDHNVFIRSFSDIQDVCYIRSEQASFLAQEDLIIAEASYTQT